MFLFTDGDLTVGVSGADVVMEDLREICIWQQASSTYASDLGMRFWDYVTDFWGNCAASPQVCVFLCRFVPSGPKMLALGYIIWANLR